MRRAPSSRLIWLPSGGHIGDAVMVLSLFGELFARHPGLTVRYLVRRNAPAIAALAEAYPAVTVVAIPYTPLKALLRILPLLVRSAAVIAPPPWGARPRYLIALSALFWLRGDTVVAFDDHARFTPATAIITHDPRSRYIDNLRRAARLAGYETAPLGAPPALALKKELPSGFPFKGRPYILIHPFPHMSTRKTLPLSRWSALIRALNVRYKEYGIVVTGAEVDRAAAEVLQKAAGEGVWCAIGSSLTELAGMIEGATLYLGIDTGPTHIAGVLHAPSVVLAQQNEPMWLPTYNPNATLIWAKEQCLCGVPGKVCEKWEEGNPYRRCVYFLSDEEILAALEARLRALVL